MFKQKQDQITTQGGSDTKKYRMSLGTQELNNEDN